MNRQIINKGKVLSFGELLFRVSLDAEGHWLRENKVPFFIGGAELNVASALALWGIPTAYFTALPDNPMSAQIIHELNYKKIDTSSIYYTGNRVGLYFLTKGADLKNDSLIYDRANSAFSELKTGMIDWDKVLQDVSWFHFSAICPAISQNIADVCLEAIEAASKRNITISIDLNYRSKLWQYGKNPIEIIPKLVSFCNVVMGNIWAAETMLGIPVEPGIHDIAKKENYLQAGLKTAQHIVERYPNCSTVANTFRFDADGGICYYTSLFTGGDYYHTENYTAKAIVNKVGSGDCFMAGLIYGFYKQHQHAALLEFATKAAFDKLFIETDCTTSEVEKIEGTSI